MQFCKKKCKWEMKTKYFLKTNLFNVRNFFSPIDMVLVFLSEEITRSSKYSQTQKVCLGCLTKSLCGFCCFKHKFMELIFFLLVVDYVKYPFWRAVEMRMLLFNIAYERAKLQLMNVKRERLLVFSLTHRH